MEYKEGCTRCGGVGDSKILIEMTIRKIAILICDKCSNSKDKPRYSASEKDIDEWMKNKKAEQIMNS